MDAVKKNWAVLNSASEDLNIDRDIFMAAVNQNGQTLLFAS